MAVFGLTLSNWRGAVFEMKLTLLPAISEISQVESMNKHVCFCAANICKYGDFKAIKFNSSFARLACFLFFYFYFFTFIVSVLHQLFYLL